MLNVGDKLICKTEGQPETEFCIRGEVKKVEGDIVTLPESELLKYYTPLDNQATDDCPVSGSIYEVTIVRTGVVFVRAATSAAAMDLADHLTTDHVNWSDDWSPTNAEERSDYDGMVFEEPDFD